MAEPAEEAADGPITQPYGDYSQRSIDWLEAKWPEPRLCPICSTDEWSVGPPVEIPIRMGLDGSFAGKGYTNIPVLCENCGYLLLFNAITAGAIPRPTDPDDGAPQ